jgi:hypothetical protein
LGLRLGRRPKPPQEPLPDERMKMVHDELNDSRIRIRCVGPL